MKNPPQVQPSKRRVLLLLSLAELLAMSVWFSASAVVPALTRLWNLQDSGQAWLTMSVQIGFVVGALASALLNLADRFHPPRLFAVSATLASVTTLVITFIPGSFAACLVLRCLSGLFLAGVYPVGMKIMASWTKKDRGLGIGLLVGALTLGSALPHLSRGLVAAGSWRPVIQISAHLGLAGAVLALIFVRMGPHARPYPPFNWRFAWETMKKREIRLANLGYLGHMWELYAVWTWLPIFIFESFQQRQIAPVWAGLLSFSVISVGGLGSVLAGYCADRWGRTRVTIAALAISGGCALVTGLLLKSHPLLLSAVCLLWGFAVVADSAQFSAAISELCEAEYIGTSLTLQTCMGFLLTMLTIRLVPLLMGRFGWPAAFAVLAAGPIWGILSMSRLRRLPAAERMAGGMR